MYLNRVNRVAGIAGLVMLLALGHWADRMPRAGLLGVLRRAVIEARGRTRIDGRKADNGYYENLMGGGDPQEEKYSRPITFLMEGTLPHKTPILNPYHPARFVVYEGKPGLDFVHPVEGLVKTNSCGFFDREHTVAKPAGVRRIAVFGDSISRGWGLPYEQRFDYLLERRLNRSGGHYEVLNFAVAGYRFPQSLDVALEKAALFKPDLYVFTFTELTVGENWGAHIAQLMRQGRDFKYDFVADVVTRSGIQNSDPSALTAWKLAPYRIEVFARGLQLAKARAEQDSAHVLVVLMPAAEETDASQRRLSGIGHQLQATGIPIIDLLDTFEGTDVESMRKDWYDAHPNAMGHRLIADQLYRKLHEDPTAWSYLVGPEILASR